MNCSVRSNIKPNCSIKLEEDVKGYVIGLEKKNDFKCMLKFWFHQSFTYKNLKSREMCYTHSYNQDEGSL